MNHETMEYKGYTASVAWSDEEGCLAGDVIGIEDNILFRGATLAEIRGTFREMIEWYLDECEKDGVEPCRPAGRKEPQARQA